MPRKIAPQVGQSLSRLLKGGYIKSPPIAYHALLAHPPSSLPPREPVQRPLFDSKRAPEKKQWYTSDAEAKDAEMDAAAMRHANTQASGSSTASTSQNIGVHRRDRLNSHKKASSQMPKLTPQPIVYLADIVRQRFYHDHPWEAFAPRTLVEGRALNPPRVPASDATDLSAWGRNPQPEDVIACVILLHEQHGLSLSQAYHHTLSSYHALRAEHEHASRSAIYEAKAHGAVFTIGADGRPSTAVETERGFRKEAEELAKGAAWMNAGGLAAILNNAGNAQAAVTFNPSSALTPNARRLKNTWAATSRGSVYLQRALAARDNVVYDESAAAPQAVESSASLLDQLQARRRLGGGRRAPNKSFGSEQGIRDGQETSARDRATESPVEEQLVGQRVA